VWTWRTADTAPRRSAESKGSAAGTARPALCSLGAARGPARIRSADPRRITARAWPAPTSPSSAWPRVYADLTPQPLKADGLMRLSGRLPAGGKADDARHRRRPARRHRERVTGAVRTPWPRQDPGAGDQDVTPGQSRSSPVCLGAFRRSHGSTSRVDWCCRLFPSADRGPGRPVSC